MAQSLAVKYRPKTIKQVLGQEGAKKVLTSYLKKAELPSAFLITGGTGLGKTTLSRIIGRTINCAEGKGCGKCDSCILFDSGSDSHPDFHELNAANARGIDDIRALVEESHYQPRYHTRIMLLDEVHQLTPQAAQSLLKDLEEPSSNTTWILATTNPEKLLKTIANRCVHLRLAPIDKMELAERLYDISVKEEMPIKKKTAVKIAEYAGGFARDAIAKMEVLLGLMRENGDKDSDKYLETAFETTEDMDVIMAAMGVLISWYERDLVQMVSLLGQVKDFSVLIQKMSFMNGYVMYTILKESNKDAKITNPYFFSYDNKVLMDAIRPDIKDKKNRKQYFEQAVAFTGNLIDCREALWAAGVSDPTGVAIAKLTKGI